MTQHDRFSYLSIFCVLLAVRRSGLNLEDALNIPLLSARASRLAAILKKGKPDDSPTSE